MTYETGMFAGLRVFSNPFLTVDGEPYTVKRTWRERLLTRPWRPLKKTRTVVPQVPDPDVYVSQAENAVFGHPDTIKTMMSEARRKSGGGYG